MAGPWEQFAAGAAPTDEKGPWSEFGAPTDKKTFSGEMSAAVTDIPNKIYDAGKSALGSITEAFNPYSESNKARFEAEKNKPLWDISGGIENLGRVGAGVMGVPQLIGAPITGTGRSVIGHGFDAIAPQLSPQDLGKLKAAGISHVPTGDEVADMAMSGVAPARGGLPDVFGSPPTPPAPPATGQLGVTLSKGQETGELPLIQREQAAVRGNSGPMAQARAQEFFDQQRGQLAAAKENISRSLDPFGANIADSPQAAGDVVSQAVRNTAAARKAGVDQAYTKARSLPGEIDADVFRGVGQKIKGDLSLRPEPVIIDDKLTPFASKAIQDIDDRVSNLFIQNKADPLGAPNPQNITGVNLNGVDQMRKRLSTFRKDAFASGNAADGRAAKAVLDAFDTQVDNAINNGLFTGDKRAIDAWNTARAAHADYRSTFTAGKNDPTGRIVEKIIGKNGTPAAIPNDVADYLYGASGINPSSQNVNVANRVKSILGDRSPEWSGVKQGLFSRLVDTGHGVTDFGPGKVAQRVNKFLNVDGRELANTVFSAPERALIQQYADIMRKMEVPQSGANWSNTASFLANSMKKLGGTLGVVVGSAIGHAAGLPWGVAEGTAYAVTRGADKLAQAAQARAVAKQLPLVADAAQKYTRALAAYNRTRSPLSSKAVGFAVTNLARSLEPLGIELKNLGTGFGAVSAPADEDKPQVDRPASQKKHGGAVAKKSSPKRHRPEWHVAKFG